jgi:hypothetical protein
MRYKALVLIVCIALLLPFARSTAQARRRADHLDARRPMGL